MRIFIKIFLWFWLAMTLIGFALAITWSLQSEGMVITSRWRASTTSAVIMYAQATALEMDRYGVDALKRHLDQLHSTGKLRAALLDHNLQPIAGDPPYEAMQLAPRAQLGAPPEFAIDNTAASTALRITAPSGREYVFVLEMPRTPPAGFRWPGPFHWHRLAIEIFVSALICYLLARYLTRPILRLRAAAGEIANGNLSARADGAMERRRDEIGGLVRDFNFMASRIESLVGSQRELMRDISHELRSPLARLTVALALARKHTGEQLSATLDRIEREAERLNDMIGQLLTLARMETADEPSERVAVKVDELIQEIVADGDFEAHERQRAVKMIGSPCEATVAGNLELLRSALENVLRNAIRHTAPGSAVEVACRRNHEFVDVCVRDHGPGVEESELPKLFRPFYRVDNARERQSGGVGLGLAITDRAVRLHGGTVHAVNHPEGGLEITVQLPCAT